MSTPIIRNGRFHAGKDCTIGENVVVDVAEEVIIGDRCVLADNTYLCGRRITVGDDFFGYSWDHLGHLQTGTWLEIGRGRIDEEDAILKVGNRCVFHDNRIDLARRVTISSDVGLSPETVIYTHGYWLSPLAGYPCKYAPVEICQGAIICFRSVLLPGCKIGARCVVGAQSVVTGFLEADGVYAGSPARFLRRVKPLTLNQRESTLKELLGEYQQSIEYRFGKGQHKGLIAVDYPVVDFCGIKLDVEKLTVEGEEDERSDDLRWFLFSHGIRIYTRRQFRKLRRK